MKTCSKCERYLKLDRFYKKKEASDGRRADCKDCHRLNKKRYYNKNSGIIKEKSKQYHHDNKEEIAKKKKIYRELNSEYFILKNKEYYSNNKKDLLAKNKEWRRLNKGQITANNARRRALKKRATPKWSQREEINMLYITARKLTEATGIQWHVDHIVPLTHRLVQGLHVLSNLRIIPYYENLQKSNKLIEDIV